MPFDVVPFDFETWSTRCASKNTIDIQVAQSMPPPPPHVQYTSYFLHFCAQVDVRNQIDGPLRSWYQEWVSAPGGKQIPMKKWSPWLIWKLKSLGLDTSGADENSSHLATSLLHFQARENTFFAAVKARKLNAELSRADPPGDCPSDGGGSDGGFSGGGFSGGGSSGGPSGGPSGGSSGGPSGGDFSGGPSGGGTSGGPSGGPSGGSSGGPPGGGNDGGGGGGGGGSSGSEGFVYDGAVTCDFESPIIELIFNPLYESVLEQVVEGEPDAAGIQFTSGGKLVRYDMHLGYCNCDDHNIAGSLVRQILDRIRKAMKVRSMSIQDFEAAGYRGLKPAQRDRAAANVTSKRVRDALVSLRTRDGPITLDVHGGVCSLPGAKVIEVDRNGRPQLVDRTPEHHRSLLAGADPSWLASELTTKQQELMDQLHIADRPKRRVPQSRTG